MVAGFVQQAERDKLVVGGMNKAQFLDIHFFLEVTTSKTLKHLLTQFYLCRTGAHQNFAC